MTEHIVSDAPWLPAMSALEEVIRCLDCGHMDRAIEFADGDGWSDSRIGVPFCCKHRRKTMEENFCSWAKRREVIR
ncbi:hypothetical protein [Adlercreutzia muris]|uniref:hypothetical protein n=1 Tax=Adlercreutzia muris TaxID=1796610 RepID=UPI0013663A08|nr:hypothetical protein [Adlercreutzia muris]NCA32136.1 hypothetical protein [Adlercreutzia muris]